MKPRMKKSLFDHLGLKILSLVLAVLIWMLIMNLDDYTMTKTIRDIPVMEQNGDTIERLGKVYSVTSGNTVDIVIQGPRSVVDPLTANDFTATANLAELSITNTVQIAVAAKETKVNGQIDITYVNNTMNLSIEDKIMKEMPVKTQLNGNVAAGYAPGECTVTPNIIKITGPESVLNRVTEVRATEDVSGMHSSFQETVKLVCYDAYGESIVDKSIEMSVEEVTMALDVHPTKSVPIKLSTVGNPASGYSVIDVNYNPQSVDIAGEESVLESVNAIYVRDVDIEGLSEKKEVNLKLTDYLPEGTYLADGNNDQLAVSIDFEQQTEREINITPADITVVGMKEDAFEYSLTSSGVFRIKLRGLKKDIQDVTKESLQLKTDVTGLEIGTHELKITYAVPKNATVVIMGSLTVDIKEKSEQSSETTSATTEATEAPAEH